MMLSNIINTISITINFEVTLMLIIYFCNEMEKKLSNYTNIQ